MGDGRDPISSTKKSEYDDAAPKLREGTYKRAEGEQQWSGGTQANGADPNYNGGNGQQPWRSGYGQVAPGAQAAARGENVTPTTTPDYTGGRAGYGQVAPAFGTGGYDTVAPNTSGTGGRAGYNEVAPGAGTGAPGEVVPRWTPKPENIAPRPQTQIANGNGDLATAYLATASQQRSASIEKALVPHVSFLGNNVVGGASAAFFAGPGSRMLDAGSKWYLGRTDGMISWAKGNPAEGQAAKAAWAESPIKGTQSAAEWWQKHFGLAGGDLRRLRESASALDVKLAQTAETLRPDFEAVQAKLGTGAATAEELALAERYNLLTAVKSTAGAPMTATQIQEIITKGGGAAEEAVMVTERGLVRGRLATLESELKASTGLRAGVKNFAKGFLAAEAAQFIDDRLSRGPFGTPHYSYGKSLVLPVTLLTPGGFIKKTLAGVATSIVGHGLDKAFPANDNPSFGRFMRPTGFETASVTAALFLPMRTESLVARSLMVGGAWLGSKTINYFFGGRSPEEAKNDAIDHWKSDKTDRSHKSMTNTIDDFKELATMGRQGDAAVTNYLANWRGRRHEDLVNGYRGSAILATALGETALNDGTFVGYKNGSTGSFLKNLTGNNPKEQDYILKGYDLDLGSVAALKLRGARIELDRAKAETQKLADQGATLRGTKVEASEVADLEKVGERIDKSLNTIYGKHDIDGAFGDFQEYVHKLNQREGARIRDNLANMRTRALARNDNDTRFMGKVARDLTLIDLAFAGSKIGFRGVGSGTDGESAAIVYEEACKYFNEAKHYDPENPDLKELQEILEEMGSKIPGMQAQQWQNTKYNPLNVNDGLRK
jgi:hypothetical protein